MPRYSTLVTGPTRTTWACSGTGTAPGRSLSFYVYRGAVSNNFIIAHDFELAKWYHIIVTMHPTNNQGAGSFAVYIDGEQQPGDTTFIYPRAVERRTCYLGKSSWGRPLLRHEAGHVPHLQLCHTSRAGHGAVRGHHLRADRSGATHL